MIEQTISIERIEDVIDIFGSFDENIKLIEHELDVSVVSRDDQLKISGEAENVLYAVKAVQGLLGLAGRKETITEQNVRYIINLVKAGNEEHINDIARDVLCVTAKGKPIKPKTLGQKRYVDAIKKNTITLGIGPAGTGKTYLAVAAAVAAFRDKQVNRIILTRPAVEAGERLGFLPGDLQSKVDPYLRPLYDALFDMLGAETYNKYLERGSIEVAPLAYMRGRTLDDSFIILDEAQNTSREQMKMFLTRLGFGSKIVITGDITQIDLPRDTVSGLKEAMRVLDGVEDIAICRLNEADVVRHVIVQRIIKAYEEDEKEEGKAMNHEILIETEVDGAEPYAGLLRRVIPAALEAEGVSFPCEVDVLFTDDEGIHAINLEQRGVDRPTDVLSFPMFQLTPGAPPTLDDVEADPGTGLVPLGDMVLSLERAEAQGAEYGHGAEREAAYLAVHSVLHLLGYDHLDEGPMKAQMREREEAILAALGITREGADG